MTEHDKLELGCRGNECELAAQKAANRRKKTLYYIPKPLKELRDGRPQGDAKHAKTTDAATDGASPEHRAAPVLSIDLSALRSRKVEGAEFGQTGGICTKLATTAAAPVLMSRVANEYPKNPDIE